MMTQMTLAGETAETSHRKPDTFVVCAETEQFILRSRRHNWPHETVTIGEWKAGALEDGSEDVDGDEDDGPYDEYDADDEVGKWFDITLDYNITYRFRVPAYTDKAAEEVAKDWRLDAKPADCYHLHTETREVGSIERQELPDDWDPYGGERIHVAIEEGEE